MRRAGWEGAAPLVTLLRCPAPLLWILKMIYAIAAIAIVAFIFALGARKKVQELEDRVVGLRAEAGSAKQMAEEVQGKLEVQAKFVEALARGDDIDHLMVREGRLYQNIDGAELQRRVEGDGAYVIDVRTPQEWKTGHISGAAHIPVDEIESRMNEVKRDGTPIHLVCAGGGRSSSAAEQLANRGYRNVFNVTGGMQAYRGDVARD